ncbi:rcc01693 family protein [Planktotalea sp.]|uniref:rcc01693 family protein n=1 Tax=Planktotalea sp. TaxID=2029877 RepID=UPI003D6AB963
MKLVNWPQLMRAGLVQLRLGPGEFWALTPAELMVMLGHGAGNAPMGRARLSDLLRAYPDGPIEERKVQDE